RFDEVEDEQTAWPQGVVHASNESAQRRHATRHVADDLADRNDDVARRKPRALDAGDAESRARRSTARETDHRRRRVDSGYCVAAGAEVLRRDPAAAADLDEMAAPDPARTQEANDRRRGLPREVAETGVVDVCEIDGVHRTLFHQLVDVVEGHRLRGK